MFIGFCLSLFYVNKQVEPFLLLALDALKIGVELIEWILDGGVDRIDVGHKMCYI